MANTAPASAAPESGPAVACIRHAEHWFDCGEGPARETDPDGDTYIVLWAGGAFGVSSANGIPALYQTPDRAEQAWIHALNEYADDFAQASHERMRQRRIWWRVKPEIHETIRHRDNNPEKWYTIYSRLTVKGPRK